MAAASLIPRPVLAHITSGSRCRPALHARLLARAGLHAELLWTRAGLVHAAAHASKSSSIVHLAHLLLVTHLLWHLRRSHRRLVVLLLLAILRDLVGL